LIESGSRHLIEKLLPHFYSLHGMDMQLDLLTCLPEAPQGFRPEQGRLLRSQDYRGGRERRRLLRELRARRHTVIAIVCSNEPLLKKYKWTLAALLPAKLLVINENADYYWVDRGSLRTIRAVMAHRAGISGMGLGRMLVRALVLPFLLAYLLLFAAGLHIRRQFLKGHNRTARGLTH